MHFLTTLSLSVVVTTLVVAAAAGGLRAWPAAAATSPVEQTAAQAFCADVNHERAARGLAGLRCTYDGSAQAAVESHQDRTDVWIPLTNNPASATVAFMQSDAHRYSLLAADATAMDVGVSCASYQPGDGSTDFGMYVGANFDQHPTAAAPPSPIVTSADTSTPCGARIPPLASPPPTRPPGALPSQDMSPAPPPPPPGQSGVGSIPPSGPSGSTPPPAGASTTSTTFPSLTRGGPSRIGSKTVSRHGAHPSGRFRNAGDRPTGLQRRITVRSGPATVGGTSSWWWVLLPTGALGVAGALLAARHKRGEHR